MEAPESEDEKSVSSWSSHASSGTDYESGGEHERGTEEKGHGEKRRKRVLRAYEFEKVCSFCFQCEFQVCALQVEVEETGDRICAVLGNSPLKKWAQKHGVHFGIVSATQRDEKSFKYLGRACPACARGQSDFELLEILRQKENHWLDRHRVLSIKLPKRLSIFYSGF